ncbi:hypothetical protein CONPUDRAFT_134454 [Coniophora puteana RWD-64-598 SS2]|uniref:Fumarylacetoacetase-like C-terminal domain-containing protein n=1 Tax=Coniophora puteana (strain RWD-64-598) TaxID=741705 RepID=A0A5M3N7M6_CONPW|nr:uncharacterized protein CONPUDRAFT_134454 [Coniophora puteana RWD-64-598 SS2]EIW87167.1 hypothetical protein CONPUDRAFT_134454 [Coniophora puteana RWD-64-598 SS2]
MSLSDVHDQYYLEARCANTHLKFYLWLNFGLALFDGQPVDEQLDVGIAAWRKQAIKAYEISGSPLDQTAQVTNNMLTVKELLVPIPREEIRTMRCLGLNYADHAAEANMDLPEVPTMFMKATTSVIGHGASICVPRIAQPVSEHLPDYEAEVAIIISKPAKDVTEADALTYVLGYAAANDVSFRKHQMMTSQACSKSFDNTTPLGSCIVSSRTISDPQNLPITFTQCLFNTFSEQIFTIAQTVSYLSQGTTLEAGSVILTGTPKGVGFTRSPPTFLKHGDESRVYIGNGIGTLVNPVIKEGIQENWELTTPQ